MASCITKVKMAYKRAFFSGENVFVEFVNEIQKVSINFNSPELTGLNSIQNKMNILFNEFVPEKELCYYYTQKVNLYKTLSPEEVPGSEPYIPIVPMIVEASLVNIVNPSHYNSLSPKDTLPALNRLESGSMLIEYSKLVGIEHYDDWMRKHSRNHRRADISQTAGLSKHSTYIDRINKLEKLLLSF
jgi:hypothetical protein